MKSIIITNTVLYDEIMIESLCTCNLHVPYHETPFLMGVAYTIINIMNHSLVINVIMQKT